MLREDTERGRWREEGQLLDAGSSVRGHVRERELQAEETHEEALQERAALPEGLLRGHVGAARVTAGEEHLLGEQLSAGLLEIRHQLVASW